jgi:hypothetical protein
VGLPSLTQTKRAAGLADHATLITLTVIGVPACTVIES